MYLGDICDVEPTRNGVLGRVRGRSGNIGENGKDQSEEEGEHDRRK